MALRVKFVALTIICIALARAVEVTIVLFFAPAPVSAPSRRVRSLAFRGGEKRNPGISCCFYGNWLTDYIIK